MIALTSCFGVLTPHTEAPVVPQSTVCPDLLQSLQIVAKLRVDGVGENLAVLAIDDVSLSVQEPCRDLELSRILDDGDETLKLVRVEFTSPNELVSQKHKYKGTTGCAPLVEVNISLFAYDVCVTTSDTLDLGQGVHNLALSINVGVEETQNVLSEEWE